MCSLPAPRSHPEPGAILASLARQPQLVPANPGAFLMVSAHLLHYKVLHTRVKSPSSPAQREVSSLPGISCAVPCCRTAITASQSAHELNTPFFMTLPAHLSQSPRPHSLLLGFSPFQFPSQLSFSGEIYCSSSLLPGSVPRRGGTAAQAIFQRPGTAILGWHTGSVSH